jgi:hypothetical protein
MPFPEGTLRRLVNSGANLLVRGEICDDGDCCRAERRLPQPLMTWIAGTDVGSLALDRGTLVSDIDCLILPRSAT